MQKSAMQAHKTRHRLQDANRARKRRDAPVQETGLRSRFGTGEERCQFRTAFDFSCGSFYISGQPCCNFRNYILLTRRQMLASPCREPSSYPGAL